MGLSPTRGSSFFLWKSDYLGCAVLLCLVVCLTLLLSSFSSPTRGSSFFLWKSDYLGCAVLLCLVVCLTLLLSSFSEERKQQAIKVKQTNKAKQHSTPKAVTFPRKNELPQVGLEPTTLYTLDRALYQLSYR